MIEVKTKVHDQYSVEFKMGFVADTQKSDFTVGMWIFVPASLDITPASFTKTEFYRCVKSNVRLITPRFALSDIVGGDALPLKAVKNASDQDYDYQLKLFCAIVKSSAREFRDSILEATAAGDSAAEDLCGEYIRNVRSILDEFWKLPASQSQEYCGEFLCNTICIDTFALPVSRFCHDEFVGLIAYVNEIRERHGFASTSIDDPTNNRNFVHRRGVLKKYVESQLFLRVPKKRDGFVLEQALYSIAAGMAMLFATVVAWAFQRHFGNLTWPLFIALIISYMLKDRIKELMRFWFAHRVSDKNFDRKAKIGLNRKVFGSLKEGMDFVRLSKVPSEVDSLRNRTHLFEAENEFIDENVILYRKNVNLDLAKMQSCSDYNLEGINDIIRLQVRPFLRKMDNPEVIVKRFDDEGKVYSIPCAKVYFVNIILQYNYGDQTEYKRYRLELDRNGIKSMEEVGSTVPQE